MKNSVFPVLLTGGLVIVGVYFITGSRLFRPFPSGIDASSSLTSPAAADAKAKSDKAGAEKDAKGGRKAGRVVRAREVESSSPLVIEVTAAPTADAPAIRAPKPFPSATDFEAGMDRS